MRKLNFQLKQLCKTSRDGSYTTQSNRHNILQKMAEDLYKLGFRGMQAKSIKQKHVEALINQYKQEGLSIGTLKNRISVLRWWANKVEKPQVVAKNNEYYEIGSRTMVAKTSKAQELDQQKLNSITDPHIRMSLELQAAFGLRREESIKFIPSYADHQDHIRLKSTWCKGGRERTIPIRTEYQRAILNKAHQLAGRGSLIPSQLSYVQQMRRYENQTSKAGLCKMHGLRHAYAQIRYQELTGWPAPINQGPSSMQLISGQKQIDLNARLIISKEMGHAREQVTAVYLGR
ncbi:phage integrase N-terminal domain-containing protein [uncultured Pseudoteredinibacter sp.]|uniref:phage integrase N-terminal domain-containing protein n=1 Tax=uncultured Pseudoteredinibacter sp. TaxID=1641701 RepID=UPI00262FD6C5|nr:phage integrase N-terminal domain-containing protein [uncultured Pseudoteredinibacter sp.]